MNAKEKRDNKNSRHKANEERRNWNRGNPRLRKRALKLLTLELLKEANQ